MPGRVSLCCGRPWACAEDLSSVLRVTRGTEEECGEGDELIMLEKVSDAEDDHSCCVFIQCAPHSGEAITSLLLESQARTIEVYAGEEYLGTSRGDVVCIVQSCSTDEEVTIYKTILHMESPEPVCKVKLLSLDGRSQVHIRRISVGVTCSRHHHIFSSMGSGIDLDSVRSMVEGLQLSSGAQQLMSMVQLQQRNPFPFENQIQHFLGKPDLSLFNGQHQVDGLHTVSVSGAATIPLSCKSNLIGSVLAQDLGNGDSTNELSTRMTQGTRDDFKAMVSAFLQKSETKNRSSPNPDLLQFLHSLCGEVKHLRIGEQDHQSQRSKIEESTVTAEMDQSKTYRFLEEVVSKQMSAMEKRLLDHIDNRMNRLQEIMDTRMVLLANLIQSSHLSTGDRPTNGEVHLYSDLHSTY